jgi:hypothetical protein
MRRDIGVRIISVANVAIVLLILLFLATDFTDVVPLQLKVLLFLFGVTHGILGWGLWRIRNWARIGTLIISALWAIISAMELLSAFRSFEVGWLMLHLALLTIYGMIIAYLLHPSVRKIFEEPPTSLLLK